MAERHDNTRPASGGTFSISRLGTFTYLPIEEGTGHAKPAQSLFIHEKPDGTLVVSIDTRFLGISTIFDE